MFDRDDITDFAETFLQLLIEIDFLLYFSSDECI